MRWLVLIAFAACASQPAATSTAVARLSGSPSVCDVSAAIAGDGLDDRAVIQAALTAGCSVQLGNGDYTIVTPIPRLAGVLKYDILSVPTGASLRGLGPATRLVFSGDAGHADWHGVGLMGNDASVSELSIDTTALVNTEEQTHAIQITAPALHVSVSRIWFYHPSRGGTSGTLGGGDCLKIVGYSTAIPPRIVSAAIADSQFVECDRSGIASIGGFYGLTITGSTFHNTGDQDIDVEGNNPAGSLVAADNVFLMGPRAQSSLSISYTAPSLDLFTFSNNVVDGRGLILYSAKRGVITGNTITIRKGYEPAIKILKASGDVAISGNTIVRTAAANAASLVWIAHLNTGMPGTFVLTGNVLRNETNWAQSVISEAASLTMASNSLEWAPPAEAVLGSVRSLIAVQGIDAKVLSFALTDNTLRGPATQFVQLRGDRYGIGSVTVQGNTGVGAQPTPGGLPPIGVRCELTSTLPLTAAGAVPAIPIGPVVISGNNWPASTGCAATAGN